MPKVVIETFSTPWMDWWAHLQLKWRGKTYPLAIRPPEDSDWSELQKGGQNGVFLLLLSFVWWGQAVESAEENSDWLEFYVDLDWVLGQLADSDDSEECEEKPTAKRFLLLFLLQSNLSNIDDRRRAG